MEPEVSLAGSFFEDTGYVPLEEVKKRCMGDDYTGVAAKVITTLQARVGHQPLGIEDICKDLNLSKRTLQRRLREQGVSFAELRDQVRFQHSIDCILYKYMKIEAVSVYLDFSDRTSFTNAFKRWTGLSPRVFKKLYQDYA